MTFTKLPSNGYSCGRFHFDIAKDDSTVGWLSENFTYVITLDGHRCSPSLSSYLKRSGYDYLQLKRLDPTAVRKEPWMMYQVMCPKNGTAAFVVKELMDIIDKYACVGRGAVQTLVSHFIAAVCDDAAWPLMRKDHVAKEDMWLVAKLERYRVYKEKQKGRK